MINNKVVWIGFTALVIAIVILLVGFVAARYIADRQAVGIDDIPVYPGATEVSTTTLPTDSSTCPALSFSVADSSAALVEEYYRQNMRNKGWLGGADTEYPAPLLFVRKVPGHFQTLKLALDADQTQVRVIASLCDQD